ncbi:MAG: CheR family methyltransferase [Gemmatimonadota bacterium]
MTAADLQAVDEVLAWAARHAGLTLAPSRTTELRQTLSRAMADAGIRAPEAYGRELAADPRKLDALLTAVTVGETYFFRDTPQIEMIRSRILPDLASCRPAGVRAWSAGCATGEEAYTLALLLLEAEAAGDEKVLGTDLSIHRLSRARAGRYRAWSLRGVDEATVQRHFRRRGAWYELDAEVRRRVEFRRLNLLEEQDWPRGMDLVLCRNVLIYLDAASVSRVARRLLGALAPGGWLVLGAADPLLCDLPGCETVLTDAGVAYRPSSGRPARRALQPSVSAAVPAMADNVPAAERRKPKPRHPAAPKPRTPVAAPTPPASAPAPEAAPAAIDAAVDHIWDLADRGLLRAAVSACDAALEGWGARADLLGLKAMVLIAARNDAAAGAAARHALYLDPGHVVAHMALGEALALSGDSVPADRAFHNAERLLADLAPDVRVTGTRRDTAGTLMALARLRRAQLKAPPSG